MTPEMPTWWVISWLIGWFVVGCLILGGGELLIHTGRISEDWRGPLFPAAFLVMLSQCGITGGLYAMAAWHFIHWVMP